MHRYHVLATNELNAPQLYRKVKTPMSIIAKVMGVLTYSVGALTYSLRAMFSRLTLPATLKIITANSAATGWESPGLPVGQKIHVFDHCLELRGFLKTREVFQP